MADERPPSRIDTTVAHPARRYNYWLGGKDHFAADRASGDQIAAVWPGVRTAALENRRFLGRVVGHLVGECGIRQFLDVGTGIPAPGNTHEVAQAVARDSRVVYVDNDPIVLAHARALTTSDPEGATAYIDADLRRPATILDHPALDLLDLERPVALLLIAVLHFLTPDDDPGALVRHLVERLPSGSYLALTHFTFDFMPPELSRGLETARGSGSHGAFQPRSREQVAAFLDGLDLIEPGLVSVTDWRPRDEPRPGASAAEASVFGALARVP
jgi:hypothetical protein